MLRWVTFLLFIFCLMMYFSEAIAEDRAVEYGTHDSEVGDERHKVRNVVLLLADDMGFDRGLVKEGKLETPTLDYLAQRGSTFFNAHATTASCSPSRSSILTGMYPHSNGHWRNTITPKILDRDEEFGKNAVKRDLVGVHDHVVTLPELLDKSGYYTGITQKWHLSPAYKFPFNKRLKAFGTEEQVKRDLGGFFLEASGRPFFLQMNIGNTHRPFRTRTNEVGPRDIRVPDILPDTPLVRSDLANYFNAIRDVDTVVKATLEALSDAGHTKDTLIIFTSDHGWPYLRAKATSYHMGTHIPLIISGPGIKDGVENYALISLIDLMPTILDFLDIEIPATVQGSSLRPWLTGSEDVLWRDLIFTEHNSHGPKKDHWYPSRSIFDGRYQYIRNVWHEKEYYAPDDLVDSRTWNNKTYEEILRHKESQPVPYRSLLRTVKRPEEELYDIKLDPYCLNDLANSKEHTDRLRYFRQRMSENIEKLDDPLDPNLI